MIRKLHESYSDINYENVWDAYDLAEEYLGCEELCLALAKGMGTDTLEFLMKEIFKDYEIPFNEEEEFDESCGSKKLTKEDYEDEDAGDIIKSYNVSYEEKDGTVYDDGSQFHIWYNPETERYSWTSDALDMSSDSDFDTEEEAYDDAVMYHEPDDGSELVIYE